MQIKLSLRQAVLSSLIFGACWRSHRSMRVRERVSDVVSGSDGLSPGAIGLATGRRPGDGRPHQSIENAPLLVFAAVGAVLFVFMVRLG
jgi:hypothetical protein